MVVEPALADRDSPALEIVSQEREIAGRVEARGVVGMDAHCAHDEAWMLGGERRGNFCRAQRLTDADNGKRARGAGARDYGVAIAGERRVREVGVAVDEGDWRAPALRGHLRSIQRSIGAAT